MNDPRYQHKVGNIKPSDQPRMMRAALKDLQHRFPNLGITLFVFDYGSAGGLMYASTANRDDMLRAINEWRTKTQGERN
jgi:hypothetical protein